MKYTLENDFLKIDIDSRGAEISGIMEKSKGYQYLWQGDPVFWENRAPVLFPVVGHLNNCKYLFEGKEYHMGLHGFAKTMEFDMVRKDADTITFSLSNNSSTLASYPFEFRLSIGYSLRERTLAIEYRVENTGIKTMWFSIGGHPAFNCSMNPEGRKDGCLFFEKRETVNRIVNELGCLTGSEEPFLIDQNSIDLASIDFDGKSKVYIMQGLQSECVTLADGTNGKKVRLNFSGFPYLGIWSPSNAAPFVCIEPWYGITYTAGKTDVLEKKRGIQRLEAGKSFICSYEIIFE